MKINFRDNLVIGILLGIIAPSIGIIGFYFVNFHDSEWIDFLRLSIQQNLLSPLLSLCCVINLGIFYLLLQFDKLFSARGVILSTFLYGFVIVMFKFFN